MRDLLRLQVGRELPPPPQWGEVKNSDEDDEEGGERGRGGNRNIPETMTRE